MYTYSWCCLKSYRHASTALRAAHHDKVFLKLLLLDSVANSQMQKIFSYFTQTIVLIDYTHYQDDMRAVFSTGLNAVNTLAHPTQVASKAKTFAVASAKVSYILASYSFTVLRIPIKR